LFACPGHLSFDDSIDTEPCPDELLDEADTRQRRRRCEMRLRVMANWHSYFRESAGPGWVLVGDAGHFKDFTPGQGISDALCQAKSLSMSISTSVGSAAAKQDAALKRWWH
jgi:2-polyprenyl-6-methoxyphenol hydroxylase-like FAD-dependent oxidoreductase